MELSRIDTFNELIMELSCDSSFMKEYERQKPYYDIILEIIYHRKQLNMSQKDLAEKSGISLNIIASIESAEYDMGIGLLIAIAEALETRIEVRFKRSMQFKLLSNREK